MNHHHSFGLLEITSKTGLSIFKSIFGNSKQEISMGSEAPIREISKEECQNIDKETLEAMVHSMSAFMAEIYQQFERLRELRVFEKYLPDTSYRLSLLEAKMDALEEIFQEELENEAED